MLLLEDLKAWICFKGAVKLITTEHKGNGSML
jgi:hypothetical protein